ncbi:UNVERIFIED_CONTAM: hypothetical protein FKN15_043242 [Acipenser sinensis]
MSTCRWCTPGGSDATDFLRQYASGSLLSNEEKAANEDLCYCLECVVEYHRAREELPSLHKSLKEEVGEEDDLFIVEDDQEIQIHGITGPEFENNLRVPLLEILKYPYLLVHPKISICMLLTVLDSQAMDSLLLGPDKQNDLMHSILNTMEKSAPGICMLLTVLDSQAMDSLLLGPDKQNDLMHSILNTMEKSAPDEGLDPFWPALQCFMVILDRLGSKVWGQLIDPTQAFQTIIGSRSYNQEIENIRRNTTGPKIKVEPDQDENMVTCSQIVYDCNTKKQNKDTGSRSALSTEHCSIMYEEMQSLVNVLQSDMGQEMRVHNSTFLWFIPFVQSVMDLKDLSIVYTGEIIHHLCAEIKDLINGRVQQCDKVTEFFILILVFVIELHRNKNCMNLLWFSSQKWVEVLVKCATLSSWTSSHSCSTRVSSTTSSSMHPQVTNVVPQACIQLIRSLLREGCQLNSQSTCKQFLDKLNLQLRKGVMPGWDLSHLAIQDLQVCLRQLVKFMKDKKPALETGTGIRGEKVVMGEETSRLVGIEEGKESRSPFECKSGLSRPALSTGEKDGGPLCFQSNLNVKEERPWDDAYFAKPSGTIEVQDRDIGSRSALSTEHCSIMYEEMQSLVNVLQSDMGQEMRVHNSTFLWFIPFVQSVMDLKDLSIVYTGEIIHHLCAEIKDLINGRVQQCDKVTEFFILILVFVIELHRNKNCMNLLWFSSQKWVEVLVKCATLSSWTSSHSCSTRVSSTTSSSMHPQVTNVVPQACIQLIRSLLREGCQLNPQSTCKQFLDKLNLQLRKGVMTGWDLSHLAIQDLQVCLRQLVKFMKDKKPALETGTGIRGEKVIMGEETSRLVGIEEGKESRSPFECKSGLSRPALSTGEKDGGPLCFQSNLNVKEERPWDDAYFAKPSGTIEVQDRVEDSNREPKIAQMLQIKKEKDLCTDVCGMDSNSDTCSVKRASDIKGSESKMEQNISSKLKPDLGRMQDLKSRLAKVFIDPSLIKKEKKDGSPGSKKKMFGHSISKEKRMGFSLEPTEKKEMDAPECLKSFPVRIKQEKTETNKQLSIVRCFDTESGSDNEDDVPLMVIKSNLEKKRMFSKEVNQNPLTDSQVDRDLGLLSLTALSKSFSFPVDSSQESSVRQLPDKIERKVRSNVRNIQKAEEEDDLIILENPVIIISDSDSTKEDNDLHVGKNKVQQSAKPEPSDVKIAEKDLDRGSSPPLYNEYDSQLFEFETEDEVFSAWDDSQMDNALASPETEQESLESSKKRNSSLEKSPDLNDMYNDWGYDTDYVPDDVIEKAAEHAEKQLMREQESVRVENTSEVSTPVFYGVKRKSSTDISSDMGSKSGRKPDENAMPSTSSTPCLTLAQKLANKRESYGNKVTSKVSNFFTSPKAAQNERKATTAASSRSTAVSCKTTSPAIVPPRKVRQREEPKSTAEKLGLKKKERKAFDLSQRSLDCVAELRNYGQHLQVEKQKRRRKSKKCQNTMLISPRKLVVKGNKKLLASQDLQFFRQSRPKKSEQVREPSKSNASEVTWPPEREGADRDGDDFFHLTRPDPASAEINDPEVQFSEKPVPLHKSDVDRQQYPKEDDLVFLWLPQQVHAYTSEEREVMEPVAHFGCVSGSNVSAAGQNDSKAILYITIKTRGNVSAVHDQPVKCMVIGSLISTLRAFKALYSLRNNMMARAILGPHVSFFRPGQENKVANLSILEYNDEQQKAINSAIVMVKQPQRTPKICLIHGPPGTGKTKTIVGFLESIFSEDQENSIPVENRRLKGRKPRVLLCAPSNAAVDHLMKKIILDFKEKSRDHKNPLGNCGDINLVRLGMEKAISKDLLGFSLDNQTKIRTQRGQTVQDTHIYRRKEDLDQQIDNLSLQCAMHQKDREKFQQLTDEKCRLLREREQLGRQLKETRSRKQEVQARVLQDAHVICCTLSTSGSILLESAFRRLGHDPFSCVIVDEAGQATEMETLIPLTYRCPALVLVGDPEQLPPTVISQKAREKRYDQSLMARLWKCLHRETKQNPGIQTPINFLSTQYRMHPDICEFPSKYIYKRALKTDGNTAEKRCGTSWPFQPYRLFDVTDGYETKAGESFHNDQEVKLVMQLIKLIAEKPKGRVGVITHYSAQKQRIKDCINREGSKLFP